MPVFPPSASLTLVKYIFWYSDIFETEPMDTIVINYHHPYATSFPLKPIWPSSNIHILQSTIQSLQTQKQQRIAYGTALHANIVELQRNFESRCGVMRWAKVKVNYARKLLQHNTIHLFHNAG